MLDPNHDSLYDLFATFFGRAVLPPDLGPIDLGSIKYLQGKRIIDFDFLGDVRATDDGCIFSES